MPCHSAGPIRARAAGAEVLRDERRQVLAGAGEERDDRPHGEEPRHRARHRLGRVPGQEQAVDERLHREREVAEDERVGEERDLAAAPRPAPHRPPALARADTLAPLPPKTLEASTGPRRGPAC